MYKTRNKLSTTYENENNNNDNNNNNNNNNSKSPHIMAQIMTARDQPKASLLTSPRFAMCRSSPDWYLSLDVVGDRSGNRLLQATLEFLRVAPSHSVFGTRMLLSARAASWWHAT